ncbi:hypothetical protein TcasGA2_TC000171 [Tribolium castaneum]|uniref:Uncharacterized protein n=1 Tax=Tribolium castaneum TaxID=7070 RepID=D6WCM9_TRICA|nr:hypothetical protein TcasGA2_TC000171 [Tribolium castaneum]
MAPSLRRKCLGRGNSKVELKEATTQTEANFLTQLQPNVVLEKMRIPENTKINDAPGSYTVFVNPITNNENANSTLLMLQNKKNLIKPGPLSYKKKMLEKLNEQELEVPIALGTIVERESEGTSQVDFSIDSNTSTRENFTQVNDECLREVPQNVRLEFEGITTVISARNTEELNEEQEEEKSEEQEDNGWKNAKYIKITASTVHIHNHFYKA